MGERVRTWRVAEAQERDAEREAVRQDLALFNPPLWHKTQEAFVAIALKDFETARAALEDAKAGILQGDSPEEAKGYFGYYFNEILQHLNRAFTDQDLPAQEREGWQQINQALFELYRVLPAENFTSAPGTHPLNQINALVTSSNPPTDRSRRVQALADEFVEGILKQPDRERRVIDGHAALEQLLPLYIKFPDLFPHFWRTALAIEEEAAKLRAELPRDNPSRNLIESVHASILGFIGSSETPVGVLRSSLLALDRELRISSVSEGATSQSIEARTLRLGGIWETLLITADLRYQSDVVEEALKTPTAELLLKQKQLSLFPGLQALKAVYQGADDLHTIALLEAWYAAETALFIGGDSLESMAVIGRHAHAYIADNDSDASTGARKLLGKVRTFLSQNIRGNEVHAAQLMLAAAIEPATLPRLMRQGDWALLSQIGRDKKDLALMRIARQQLQKEYGGELKALDRTLISSDIWGEVLFHYEREAELLAEPPVPAASA